MRAVDSTRILVIDHDEALCDGLDLLWSSYGHIVHTCRSLREGRKLLGSLDIDALLIEGTNDATDLKAFCQSVRKSGHDPQLFLMLPQGQNPGTMLDDTGASGFIEKPFLAMELLSRLAKREDPEGEP